MNGQLMRSPRWNRDDDPPRSMTRSLERYFAIFLFVSFQFRNSECEIFVFDPRTTLIE